MENLFFIYILGQGNIMKKVILGAFILCGVLSADCVRNSNKTVSCSETKLMWQDDKNSKTIMKNLKNAIKYCRNLAFAGYSDWRLPNKKELLNIVDFTKDKPIINNAFKNTKWGYYWSSTGSTVNSANAWSVHLGYGGIKENFVGKGFYVRCVRDE